VQVAEAEARSHEANRLRDAAGRRLEQLRMRTGEATTVADAAAADVADVRALEDGFTGWLRVQQGSFGMLLLSALRSQDTVLRQEWDGLRSTLESPHPMPPHNLRELHARFVRRVLLAALLAIVATIVIAVVVPTAHGEDWSKPWLRAALREVEKWGPVALVAFAFALLGFLVSYHRGISQHRMALHRQMGQVKRAAAAVKEIRIERVRLESLHGQVPEFLELISEVTHRPWIVAPPSRYSAPRTGEHDGHRDRPRGAVTDEGPALVGVPRPDVRPLPGHIRLAEPVLDGTDPRAAARVREAVWLKLRPGWRAEAFASLLRLTEESMSLPPGSLDEHVLDRDSRQRQMLLDSLLSRPDGTGVPGLYLQERLGAEVVREIAQAYSTTLLGDTQHARIHALPVVREITVDAIDGIDVRVDLLEHPDAVRQWNWNDYLSELLTGRPELSWHELAGEAKSSIHHGVLKDALRAYVVAPGRLIRDARSRHDNVRYEPLLSSGALPVELVVRLDQRTLPKPGDFALFRYEHQRPTTIDISEPAKIEVDVRQRAPRRTPPVNY